MKKKIPTRVRIRTLAAPLLASTSGGKTSTCPGDCSQLTVVFGRADKLVIEL